MPSSVPNQHPSRPPAPGAPRLAIVGEAPGSEEVRLGYPFAGASGSYLNSVLAYAGIDRQACFVGNVCQFQPPGNQFTAWRWSDDRIQAGIAALLADLAAFAPNLILTLGNVPLHLFKCGNVPPPVFKNGNVDWPNKVSVWRGSLFAAAISLCQPIPDPPKAACDAQETPREGTATLGGSGGLAFDQVMTMPQLLEVSEQVWLSTLRAPHDPHPLPSPASAPGGPGAPPALEPPFEPLAHTTRADQDQAAISQPDVPSLAITGAGEGVAGPSLGATLYPLWKCLATYHPAFVLRSWKHHIDLCLDMKRARLESQTPTLDLPALEVACGPCE